MMPKSIKSNRNITNRFFNIFAVIAFVATTSLLSAQVGSTTGSQTNKPDSSTNATSSTPKTKTIKYQFSVIKVELKQEYEFGSGVSSDQVTDKVSKEGVRKTAKDLQKFGTVKLLFQEEAEVVEDESARIFSGSETPFLTTTMNETKDGGTVRSSSQSTVASGLSVEFSPTDKDKYSEIMEQSIDLDFAYPVKRGESTLIERFRFNSEYSIILNDENQVHVKRHFRQIDDKNNEIYFISQFNQNQ